jgi:hypothetical protein
MDCAGQADEVAVDGDCADSDPLIHEDAIDEPCDGVDNDCDGAQPQCVRSLSDASAFLVGGSPFGLAKNAAFVGDVDGDGRDDVGVTSSGFEVNTTAVHVLSGAVLPGATGVIESYVSLTVVDSIYPEAPGPLILPADDVNMDGFDDFWVGTPQRVIYGGSSGVVDVNTDSDIAIDVGIWEERGFAASGDANGDGIGDLLFTDSKQDSFLFVGPFAPGTYGPEDAQLSVSNPLLDQRGTAEIADLDGDGAAEIVLGTDCEDTFGDGVFGDYVGVYVGAADGTLSGTYEMPENRDAYDFWIDCSSQYEWDEGARAVGDVNGDGYTDLATADQYTAYVLPGPLAGALDPFEDATLKWQTVTPDYIVDVPFPVDDFDGDGTTEFAFLAKGQALDGDPEMELEVHIVAGGQTGLLDPTGSSAVWAGLPGDNWIGATLRSGGDADADGLDDVILSVYEDYAYPHTGHFYWLSSEILLSW